MSVEKLSDDSKFTKEKVPYAQICTSVINNIKDGDAFLVWCYLQSKTKNWKVIKQDIKKKYSFGNTKLKNIFSYLNRSNLIKYVQGTSANGKFAPVDILVLNGSKFDKNQQFICSEPHSAPVGQETVPPVHRTIGFGPLLNKDITKQRKELNKYSCSSSDERLKFFDEFWQAYPKKKKKMEAKRIWVKFKLDEKSNIIIAHVKKRLSSEWHGKDKQFIPFPDSFLNKERWTDEIEQVQFSVVKNEQKRINETKSTIMEWGPGHPSWEELYGPNSKYKKTM